MVTRQGEALVAASYLASHERSGVRRTRHGCCGEVPRAVTAWPKAACTGAETINPVGA